MAHIVHSGKSNLTEMDPFPIQKLPTDVQIEIINKWFYADPEEMNLKTASLVSKHLRKLIVPFLFQNFQISTRDQYSNQEIDGSEDGFPSSFFEDEEEEDSDEDDNYNSDDFIYELDVPSFLNAVEQVKSRFDEIIAFPGNRVASLKLTFLEAVVGSGKIDMSVGLKNLLSSMGQKLSIDLTVAHCQYREEAEEDPSPYFRQALHALPPGLQVQSLVLLAKDICSHHVGLEAPFPPGLDTLTIECGTFGDEFGPHSSRHMPLPFIRRLNIVVAHTYLASGFHPANMQDFLHCSPTSLRELSIQGDIISKPKVPFHFSSVPNLQQLGYLEEDASKPLDRILLAFAPSPAICLVVDSLVFNNVIRGSPWPTFLLEDCRKSFNPRLTDAGFRFNTEEDVPEIWGFIFYSIAKQKHEGGWRNLVTLRLGYYAWTTIKTTEKFLEYLGLLQAEGIALEGEEAVRYC
ncbi:hypothetical protein BT69DRAFT_1286438 [Atractiella rhizophila]|nr:hypothetical protein BT69DRAFT_1286438 [Atractiella rhizophila]